MHRLETPASRAPWAGGGLARLAPLSAGISVLLIGVLSAWSGWARRWISDDGLIVLRTVRNLAAGNGPVFNAGERVEANTSTVWQYLIYGVHAVSGAKLELIALWLALLLSVAAMCLGAGASAALWNARRFHLVLPAGALVYLALPPARDFFTSGLEWGLSIFYLAALWAVLLCWAQRPDSRAALLLAAWWAGMSWLVRPELALYGAAAGALLLWQHRSWRAWLAIFAVALPLPAGYQVFRMGYYGLLTPHTAVAKSAADSSWSSGFAYLRDFVGPYWLWLPLFLLAAWAVVGLAFRREPRREFFRTPRAGGKADAPDGAARHQPARISRPALVVAVMFACALVHLLYVLRVGGDFMHGRMLLLPLFAALLPVFVIPVRSWRSLVLGLALAVWGAVVAWRGHPTDWEMFQADSLGTVDEREFWTFATKRAPGNGPLTIEDFADVKLLQGFDEGLADLASGDALSVRYLASENPQEFSWMGLPADPQRSDPPTLYLVNMGMSSMRSPLDVRVLDNIGLANPLAARQPRVEDGRIGHDKNLGREWQVADTAVDLNQLPSWIDADAAARARQALEHPDFQELFGTYRAPLDGKRFWENIKWSLCKGRTLHFNSDPEFYLR
ncbi:flagellar motor control protein ZomB [Corynebacterium lizhenjunii]|uniref:flagellar motor control protein ZomB n=1 Tax=Corynebacterium lizhenjunii TaxID=2709394 RepID=UPI0013E9AEAB|nr:flagellar motor control protein ZomB [Corynebacterium lizhenjunii]